MDSQQIVWIRSGGRCAICNKYLLDNDLGSVVSIGENAHIVGREKIARSPRGLHDLPVEERDKPENLILLCREQHRIIDNRAVTELYTVDELRRIKLGHESRIRQLTELKEDNKTVVFRLLGDIRGTTVEIDRKLVASAVLESGRYPSYPLSAFHDGLEVDIRGLANEGSVAYYAAAVETIDRELTKLENAIRKDIVQHVSVFCYARLPLLIYLGRKLDDTTPTDVYQRHRLGDNWTWPKNSDIEAFQYRMSTEMGAHEDHVLIVNTSGTIHLEAIPEHLRQSPIHYFELVNGSPSTDYPRNRETLNHFASKFREFLSILERDAPKLKRLHLFAAVSISFAVAVGRCMHYYGPDLAVYEDVNGKRTKTMEILA